MQWIYFQIGTYVCNWTLITILFEGCHYKLFQLISHFWVGKWLDESRLWSVDSLQMNRTLNSVGFKKMGGKIQSFSNNPRKYSPNDSLNGKKHKSVTIWLPSGGDLERIWTEVYMLYNGYFLEGGFKINLTKNISLSRIQSYRFPS